LVAPWPLVPGKLRPHHLVNAIRPQCLLVFRGHDGQGLVTGLDLEGNVNHDAPCVAYAFFLSPEYQ